MKIKDFFLALLITAIWGLNFVFIKLGLNHFPPFLFCSLRFFIAALPVVFFKPDPQIKWIILLKFGFVFGVIKFSCLYLGLSLGVNPGIASLILQSQVIFTLLLSFFLLKEKMDLLKITGILIASLGVLGVFHSSIQINTPYLGMLFLFIAAFSWGITNIFMKKIPTTNMLKFVSYSSLIPPMPLVLISFLLEEKPTTYLSSTPLSALLPILYIGLVSTVFGYGIWGKLLNSYSTSTIAPFSLLVPVFGMLSSFLILKEGFSNTQLFSSGAVLVGLTITLLNKKIRLIFKKMCFLLK